MELVSISPASGKKIKTNGKLLGASFIKKQQKWMSSTKKNGKFVFLGYYNTEIEAHQKYMEFWEEINKTKEILPENTKICSKCNEIKDFSQFHKNKNSPDGYYSWCKECKSMKWKGSYGKELRKKRYQNNKESIKIRSSKFYRENKESISKKKSIYKKQRLQDNKLFKLTENIRCLIYCCFKNKHLIKKSKTRLIIGCSYEELEQHLISSVIKNYGIYLEDLRIGNCEQDFKYEIDHIIPISSAKTEEDVIKLNHYTNLQWLIKKDNRNKRDNIDFTLTEILT